MGIGRPHEDRPLTSEICSGRTIIFYDVGAAGNFVANMINKLLLGLNGNDAEKFATTSNDYNVSVDKILLRHYQVILKHKQSILESLSTAKHIICITGPQYKYWIDLLDTTKEWLRHPDVLLEYCNKKESHHKDLVSAIKKCINEEHDVADRYWLQSVSEHPDLHGWARYNMDIENERKRIKIIENWLINNLKKYKMNFINIQYDNWFFNTQLEQCEQLIESITGQSDKDKAQLMFKMIKEYHTDNIKLLNDFCYNTV